MSKINDKPEPGKAYSIMDMIGGGGNWVDAAIVPDAYPVGTRLEHDSRWHGRQHGTVIEARGTHGQTVIFDDFTRGQISVTRRELREGVRDWRVLDEPLRSAEQIAELLRGEQAKRAQDEADRAEAARQKAAETVATAAELRRKYKWAKPRTEGLSEYARAAANIKKELAREFPGVKFSVRSESFSMGNSVTVSWTLGPTAKQVDEIVNKYQDGHFDGMQDMYEHDTSAYGNAVSEVLGRAKYVSTSRTIPHELYEKAGRALCELQHVEYAGEYTRHLCGERDSRPLNEHVGTLLYGSAFPVGVSDFISVEHTPMDEQNGRDWVRLVFEQTAEAAKPEPVAVETPAEVPADVTRDGAWTWISFPAKPPQSVIDRLKTAGARWSRKRAAWYFSRPVDVAELFPGTHAPTTEVVTAETPVVTHPAECDVCGEVFSHADAGFARTMRDAHKGLTHPEPVALACETCGREFADESAELAADMLEAHKGIAHKPEPSPEPYIPDEYAESARVLQYRPRAERRVPRDWPPSDGAA